MSLKHHLKMWFQQKIWSKPDKSHSEETVALPEVHTGKVHHPAEDTSHATGEHPHAEDPSITTTWPFPRCTSTPVGTNKLHRQKSCCPLCGKAAAFCFVFVWTLQADVLQDEQHGQHIHQRADLLFLGLAGDHIDDGPGDHTNGNASEMLYAVGMARTVRKAGMPSLGSLKSILTAEPIM